MSNLVPEKRVNKNGFAVTKHVRADSKNRTVSLPAINAASFHRRPPTPLFDENIFLGEFARENIGVAPLPFTLDDLDPDAVVRIEELLQADDAKRPRAHVIQSGISDAMGSDTVEQCVTRIHNIAAFGEAITKAKGESIVGFIVGLDKYPESIVQPDVDYFLEGEPQRKEGVEALITFTIGVNSIFGSDMVYDSFMDTLDSESGVKDFYIKLHDDKLAAYIVEHPDRAEEIQQILEQERKVLSAELLDDRLNHEVQSMRDGVL